MPEYALIMSQYVHICLNNTEYDWIYQNITEKKSAECQNSECVYAVQSNCTNCWAVIETDVVRTLSNI